MDKFWLSEVLDLPNFLNTQKGHRKFILRQPQGHRTVEHGQMVQQGG